MKKHIKCNFVEFQISYDHSFSEKYQNNNISKISNSKKYEYQLSIMFKIKTSLICKVYQHACYTLSNDLLEHVICDFYLFETKSQLKIFLCRFISNFLCLSISLFTTFYHPNTWCYKVLWTILTPLDMIWVINVHEQAHKKKCKYSKLMHMYCNVQIFKQAIKSRSIWKW